MLVVEAEGIEPQCRKHKEIENVEKNVQENVRQLYGGKLDRTLFVAQIGKGNALEGIDGDADEHDGHPILMVRVAHPCGNRP